MSPLPAAIALLAAALSGSQATWEETLEEAVPAVVAIRSAAPRSFDTDKARTSSATGFVVDAERGIILTNRHVVTPGPVVAEAVFLDHEEVQLQAIYRDPVHDYGFFRFDPGQVRFMETVELALHPDGAHVGAEIRVIGNDAGEKLSILEGTIARLDREAPNYGRGRYNDFNTFYYQAASGTSGGSSGSPVVDLQGRVVALNAGSNRKSASSFYLPLHRIARALELIQQGKPVTRGTLQTIFEHKSYDELTRLGLQAETEATVREAFEDGIGMLVVQQTVPGGPGHRTLEPGDVLLRAEGELLIDFLPLEALLDERVGQTVKLEVARGGELLELELAVQDLHSVSPSSYLEVGSAVLNNLSYQIARTRSVPAQGVYVASSGYMLDRAGIPRGSVILGVGDEPVSTIEELERVLSKLPDGAEVPFRFYALTEPRRVQFKVVEIDRRWHPMQRCVRDDSDGTWPCTPSPAPPPAAVQEALSLVHPPTDNPVARKLAPSLVYVEHSIPYKIDGVHGEAFSGTGLVVDAERGLLVVDRNTVPVGLGDVKLTFGGSVELPGRIEWLHPIHNFAVVRYDPGLLEGSAMRSARLCGKPLDPESAAWIVGLTGSMVPRAQESKVTSVEPLTFPKTDPPRYQASNVDVVVMADQGGVPGGVLTDRSGCVRALWASYSFQRGKDQASVFAGLPIVEVLDVLEALRAGERPVVRDLGVGVASRSLSDARSLGLPDSRVAARARVGGSRPGVLMVTRRTAGSPGSEVLQEGDLILQAAGQTVYSMRDLQVAAQSGAVVLEVLRDRQLVQLDVAAQELGSSETDRAVLWAGLLLQAPHRALAVQQGVEPDGVYISLWWKGSPAARYRIRATHRILEVDGQPTPDLDSFLAAVDGKQNGASVRVRTIDLAGQIAAKTLKLDTSFWPTSELRWESEGWVRVAR